MPLPANEHNPNNGGVGSRGGSHTGDKQKKQMPKMASKRGLPSIIQNLIRPGNIPLGLGLREPPLLVDESPVARHDIIQMAVSRIIHHDENMFQYSSQVSMQFYAVHHTFGRCAPLTTSLNLARSSELPLNSPSHLATSDDGYVLHEINVDLRGACSELLSGNTVLLFELTGSNVPFVGADNARARKAWAFFRPK